MSEWKESEWKKKEKQHPHHKQDPHQPTPPSTIDCQLAAAYYIAENSATADEGGWIVLKRHQDKYTFAQGTGSASGDDEECPFKFHVSINPTQIVAGAMIVLDVLNSYMDIVAGIKVQNSKKPDTDRQPSKQINLIFRTPCPKVSLLRTIFAQIDSRLTQSGIGVDPRSVNTEDNISRRKFDRIIMPEKRFSYRNELCTFTALPVGEMIGGNSDMNHYLYPGAGMFIFDERYFASLKDTPQYWHNASKQSDPYIEL